MGAGARHGSLEEEAVLPDDLVGVRYSLLDPFGSLAIDRAFPQQLEVLPQRAVTTGARTTRAAAVPAGVRGTKAVV
jgi:hypothetical protein